MRLMDKVEEYVQMRNKKDEINKTLRELNKQIQAIEEDVISELEENNLKSVKTQEGVMLTTYIRSSVRASDKEALVGWMLNRGYDSMLTVNPRTLTAFYNERLKANEEVPPGTEQYTQTKISLRR